MRRTTLSFIVGGIALALSGGAVHAQFQVRQTYLNTATSTGNAGGGTNAAQLENIEEGEALLSGTAGFVQSGNFTATPDTINYSSTNFPGSGGLDNENTNHFALEAIGVINILSGAQLSGARLYVNSDDGFRLRINGTTVSQFTGPVGDSNQMTGPLTLNDGDVVRLTFFELGGGEKLFFQRDADGDLATTGDRTFVGDVASGIDIVPVPEPASLGLVSVGLLAAAARRRRVSSLSK